MAVLARAVSQVTGFINVVALLGLAVAHRHAAERAVVELADLGTASDVTAAASRGATLRAGRLLIDDRGAGGRLGCGARGGQGRGEERQQDEGLQGPQGCLQWDV